MEDLLHGLSVYAIPILFAITMHEAAHGLAAWALGDDTARRAGRVSLDPLRHIDPVGTVLLPVLFLFATGGKMVFGWAKPVPVDFGRLRHPKVDMAKVALAGPAANFVMALLWRFGFFMGESLGEGWFSSWLEETARAGVIYNILIMLLNLFPFPPLDGGRVLVGILPRGASLVLSALEPWGLVIILFFLATGLLWQIIMPFFALFLFLFGMLPHAQ